MKMVKSISEKVRSNMGILIILAISLLLRILFSLDNVKSLFVDIKSYEDTGVQILKSGIYSVSAYHPPVYPLFIAMVYKLFGQSYLYVYILQSLMGMGITLFIYLIGKNVFDRKTGLISAGVSLLYWPLTLYSGILMSEIVFIFLVLGGVYFFLKGLDSGKVWFFVLCGLFLALSSLTRSLNLLLLFILPAVYVLFRWKQWKLLVRNILAFGLVFVLTISPWAIRNYVKYHEVILVDTLGGLNLYIGNNDAAGGLYVFTTEDEKKKIIQQYVEPNKALKDIEVSDANLKKATYSYMRHHILRTSKLTTWRLALFATYDMRDTDWVLTTYMAKNSLFHYNFWNFVLFFGDLLFFFLAVIGLPRLLKNKKGLILLGFIVYYTGLTSLFYISQRYRLPIMPFMAIAAAFSVQKLAAVGNGLRKRLVGKAV